MGKGKIGRKGQSIYQSIPFLSIPSSRYGKIKDLKSFAKAVSFLQGNNISTLSELQETLTKMKNRYWNTNSEIKAGGLCGTLPHRTCTV